MTYDSSKNELLWQGLRYALSCALMLGLKIAMTSLACVWLQPLLAYLLAHAVIFFVSYTVHSRFTFGVPRSRRGMGDYFCTVIAFKVIDYIAFAFLSTSFGLNTPLGIVLASAFEFTIRFYVVRKILFSSHATSERPSPLTFFFDKLLVRGWKGNHR